MERPTNIPFAGLINDTANYGLQLEEEIKRFVKGKNWQKEFNSLQQNELIIAAIFTVMKSPNNTCRKKILYQRVLQLLNVRTHGGPKLEFKESFNKALQRMIKTIKIFKEYNVSQSHPRIKFIKNESSLAILDMYLNKYYKTIQRIDQIPFVLNPTNHNSQESGSLEKKLTPLEFGELCRRMEAKGESLAEISRKTGKSMTYINDCINLSYTPSALQEAVRSGQISGTRAIKLMKEIDPVELEALIEDANMVLDSEGRKPAKIKIETPGKPEKQNTRQTGSAGINTGNTYQTKMEFTQMKEQIGFQAIFSSLSDKNLGDFDVSPIDKIEEDDKFEIRSEFDFEHQIEDSNLNMEPIDKFVSVDSDDIDFKSTNSSSNQSIWPNYSINIEDLKASIISHFESIENFTLEDEYPEIKITYFKSDYRIFLLLRINKIEHELLVKSFIQFNESKTDDILRIWGVTSKNSTILIERYRKEEFYVVRQYIDLKRYTIQEVVPVIEDLIRSSKVIFDIVQE